MIDRKSWHNLEQTLMYCSWGFCVFSIGLINNLAVVFDYITQVSANMLYFIL